MFPEPKLIVFPPSLDEDCVVVNGYFPSLTIKSVLTTITEEILDTETTFSSNTEHVAYILGYYPTSWNILLCKMLLSWPKLLLQRLGLKKYR